MIKNAFHEITDELLKGEKEKKWEFEEAETGIPLGKTSYNFWVKQ